MSLLGINIAAQYFRTKLLFHDDHKKKRLNTPLNTHIDEVYLDICTAHTELTDVY